MKLCEKCRTSNEDENVVCTFCGAVLEAPKNRYDYYKKPGEDEVKKEEKPKETFKQKLKRWEEKFFNKMDEKMSDSNQPLKFDKDGYEIRIDKDGNEVRYDDKGKKVD